GSYCDGTTNSCQTGSSAACKYDGNLTARYSNSLGTGRTFTLFQANASTSNIVIENCGFWTYQSDPFQRCSRGTKDALPCKQYCNGATTSLYTDVKCEASGSTDCGGGGSDSCLGRADCATGGGTCNGAPLSPSGTGKINVLDLGNTTHAVVRNV